MDKGNYMFYAFNINGDTEAIFKTPEEALDELSTRFIDDDSNAYEVEPIRGIWNMLERFSSFNDRSDDFWMADVLQGVCQMIFDKSGRGVKDSEKPTKDTNSKN